jgi:hypothetical protein
VFFVPLKTIGEKALELLRRSDLRKLDLVQVDVVAFLESAQQLDPIERTQLQIRFEIVGLSSVSPGDFGDESSEKVAILYVLLAGCVFRETAK